MITNTIASIVLVVFSFSCQEKDLYDTFEEFTPDNVVSVSAARTFPLLAKEKALMLVQISADPKIKKGTVTDLDGEVKFTFNVDRTIFEPEIIFVEFEAEEGLENVLIYLEDAQGIRSVSREVTIEVLGEEHRSSLLNREIETIDLVSSTEATINWISNTEDRIVDGVLLPVVSEPLLVETAFTYTDTSGMQQTIIIDSTEDLTTIVDIQEGTDYSYTSTYKTFEEDFLLEILDSPFNSDLFITDEVVGTFPLSTPVIDNTGLQVAAGM